ncbi:hypothetical protein [Halorubellus sp. JP-L1]|nr:hypothetical protein [Halorubellus sp. JP-L1]
MASNDAGVPYSHLAAQGGLEAVSKRPRSGIEACLEPVDDSGNRHL